METVVENEDGKSIDMYTDSAALMATAQQYIGTAAPLTVLGGGMSGYVFMSPIDRLQAIKVHRDKEKYAIEVEAYHRLMSAEVTKLHGLTIPRLIDARPDLLIITMEIVSPPFLLDFAGVQFVEPDFNDEVLADWQQRIVDMFGVHAEIANAVYTSLAELDIYYLDFRPSNLKLDGHPDLRLDDPIG